MTVGRAERWAIAAIVGLFAAVVAAQIATGGPLDYDETVYAMRGRAWLEPFPTSGWAPYRAPALPVVSWLIGHVTFDDWAYKAVGVVAGVGLLLAVWALGRRVYGPVPALLTAAAVAGGSELQVQSGQFLTDVPTAALLVAMTWLAWRALEHEHHHLLPLVSMAAFGVYSLRYGAAPMVAISLIAFVTVWRAALRARPRGALIAAGALVALAIPHLVYAIRTFGSPVGQFTYTLTLAHRDEPTNGLWSYVRWTPNVILGRAAGALAVAGVIATVVALARAARARRLDKAGRAAVVIGLVGMVDIVVLGVAAPSQPRYVFFPVALLALAGAGGVVRAWRAVATRIGARIPDRAAAVATGLALAVMFALGSNLSFERWRGPLAEHRIPVKQAGLRIGALAARRPCGIVSTAMPQLTWYSGCFTATFGEPPVAGRERLLPQGDRFLVLIDGVRNEPTGALRSRYLSMTEGTPVFTAHGDHLITVYRLGSMTG